MQWRIVSSVLLIVLLVSCRTKTDTLSISQLDSYHHGALLNLFDTLTITYYPNILDNRVNGGFAGINNPDNYRPVYAGTATIQATRHTILSDSATTSRSMERKGSRKNVISPIVTTSPGRTKTWLYTLLLGSLGLIILHFLIRRL